MGRFAEMSRYQLDASNMIARIAYPSDNCKDTITARGAAGAFTRADRKG